MIQAFNSDADFTGISANGQFCIATVLHKVFLEVCESGTEAAAATVIGIAGCSRGPKPEPKLFTADRPFIFLIQEKSSGVILFIGKVMNPVE
jgi:serpin B